MTVFSVRDTGTGIPEDMIDDIFQPFYSTKGADNSGLGLAVIRGIILRHGGNISVESKLGEGTRFTVSLPAAQRLEDHEEAAAPAAKERGPLHILVVDDTRPIADFASTALRRMGHKADTVYDGNAALARLRENAFDVLLTDYGMEGLSGVSLAREAQRMHPNIKTVIMTGWDLAAGEFEGIDAALAKPFTIGQLKELIEEGL
jgi:CheY-like chemotaxis protein